MPLLGAASTRSGCTSAWFRSRRSPNTARFSPFAVRSATALPSPEAEFCRTSSRWSGPEASGAQAVLLANPQSPSGRLMRAGSLLQLYEAACAMARLPVDEALLTTRDESLCGWAAKLPA